LRCEEVKEDPSKKRPDVREASNRIRRKKASLFRSGGRGTIHFSGKGEKETSLNARNNREIDNALGKGDILVLRRKKNWVVAGGKKSKGRIKLARSCVWPFQRGGEEVEQLLLCWGLMSWRGRGRQQEKADHRELWKTREKGSSIPTLFTGEGCAF